MDNQDLLSIPVTSFNGRKTLNDLTAGWSNDGKTYSISLCGIIVNFSMIGAVQFKTKLFT